MNDPARVEQLFNEALQRANHIERHVFLTGACGNDTGLWNEVWDRLRSQPPTRVTGKPRKTRGIRVAKAPPTNVVYEKPGDLIGPYRLLQILDENACGVMWMAERNQRVADFVAIKIMQAAANDFLLRYEAQKHALALLDHPSIARPHSGGMTAGGRPYLVTELLHGTPITQFCDDQKLPMLQRVRLFVMACDAVQHAHQQGVVHGDLKPANLLVKWGDDGKPVLKIMDFGVARAMNHVLTTPEGWLRMPACYMSPEHAHMKGIDARSDVYSLGVLLYELVTGRLPFVMPRETDENLEEIQKIICEAPPNKPSECLAALPKAQLSGVSLARQVEAAKIIGLMQEHFDWIVMRTLDKRPAERHTTVSALMNDFQRYLAEAAAQEEEPRPQGSALGTFISEHRGLMALAAILVLSLVSVMGIIGWLLVKEKQEEVKVAAKKRSESHSMTARFLEEMFGSLTQEKVKGHDTTLVKNMLDEATERLDTLAESPEAGARTQETIGLTYLALSQPLDAQRQLQGALDKRKLALGGDHPDTLRSMRELAVSLKEQGRFAEAEVLLTKTLQAQQRTLGKEHKDTFVTITVLAAVCDAEEKHVEAESLYLQLWKMQQQVLGPDHLDTLATIGNLASSYTLQGRHAEAMKLREEQLQKTERVLGTGDPRTLVTMNITAQACEAGGMPSEAEKLYFGALEVMKRTLGMEHPETLAQMDRAAQMLGRRGRHEEALKLRRQSLEMRRQVLGVQHPQTLLTLKHMAEDQDALGRQEEAEKGQLQVLETLRTAFPPDHPEILTQMDQVAEVYEDHGKPKESVLLRQHTLEARQKALGTSHPQTLASMRQLARSMDADGRKADAEKLQLQTLETMKTAYGGGDPDVLAQMYAVAAMHARHGKLAEAETMCVQLLQIQTRLLGTGNADTLHTMTGLAAIYQQQGRLTDAEKQYQEVLDLQRQQPGATPLAVAAATASLGEFWLQTGRFAEAETLLRECAEVRRQNMPAHWLRFSTESLLGGAMLGQKKYAEAGILLRSGYEGLNSFGASLPEEAQPHLRAALERLAQFTEATGGVAEAAEWRLKMAEFREQRQIARR